jgi:L-asparaginase
LARVAVVFTGGTISMGFDPVAGGNVPTLDGAAILVRTPGLDAIAEVVPIDRGLTPASHFSFADVLAIGGAVQSTLDDPAVDGLVVVQGTDTIEEWAFGLDLLLPTEKPVVIVGAMRTFDSDDYDGPANLRAAVRTAASPRSQGQGVVVTMGGRIWPADDVVKVHASALDAFDAPNAGALGLADHWRVRLTRQRGGRRRLGSIPERSVEPIDLLTAVSGMDGRLLRLAIADGARGIVVAATGSGNTHPDLLDGAREAIAAGLPVVLTTRCLAGRVEPRYAFPGGGAQWFRAGAIPAGYLSGPKARLALALGLGAGLDDAGLRTLLAGPGPILAP